MKRRMVLQLMIMYVLVTLNITPIQVKAQEQFYASDLEDVVSVGENVSSSLIGQKQDLYLMNVPKDQQITVSVEETYSDTEEEVNTGWKILKINREPMDTEVLYSIEDTILDEKLTRNDENSYSFQKTIHFEKSYYLIMFENNSENVVVNYDFSTKEIITYATELSIPKSMILTKGKDAAIKVTNIKPQNAVAGITWSSSDSSIVKINSKTGKITGKKYGQTYIKATLHNGTVYKCKISVEQPKLSKSSILLIKGDKTKIKVSKNYNKVSYSSSNKSAAVVTSTGIITAKGKGTAKITAKVGKTKLTCTVKVEAPKINKTRVTLTTGKSQKLKVTGTTQKVTWHSSDSNVAAVNSSGKVTTKNAGSATISASVAGKTVVNCYIVVKTAQKKTTTSNTGSKTVYITETGAKYHRSGCRYLWHSCIPTTLESARACGYEPCSVCY